MMPSQIKLHSSDPLSQLASWENVTFGHVSCPFLTYMNTCTLVISFTAIFVDGIPTRETMALNTRMTSVNVLCTHVTNDFLDNLSLVCFATTDKREWFMHFCDQHFTKTDTTQQQTTLLIQVHHNCWADVGIYVTHICIVDLHVLLTPSSCSNDFWWISCMPGCR